MAHSPRALAVLLLLVWLASLPAPTVAAPAWSGPPITGYRFPFPAGDRFFVTRGGSGHGNAVDLFPQNGAGAIVVAARAGRVTRVVEVHSACGCNRPANFVRIQPADDGVVDEYLHLQHGSAGEFGIAVGVWVAQGQPIGRVGNTGCVVPCDANHLHMHVYDVANGMEMNFYPMIFDEIGQEINVAWDGYLINTLPSPPCVADCIGGVANGERPTFESSTTWDEQGTNP